MLKKLFTLIRNKLRTLLVVGFIFVFGTFIFSNYEKIFLAIEEITLSDLVLLFVLIFIGQLLKAIINIKLYNLIDIRLKMLESLDLVFINSVGNNLGPLSLGAGYKFSYLNEKHRLNFSEFFSINFLFSIVSALTSLIFIFVFLGINYITYLIPFLILAVFFLVFRHKIVNWVKNIFPIENINTFFTKLINNTNGKNLFSMFLLIVLQILLNSLIYYTIFKALKIPALFDSAFMYTNIGTVTNLVKLTPGNLGFLELVLISMKNILGLTTSDILSTTIVSRIGSYGTSFTYLLFKKIFKK